MLFLLILIVPGVLLFVTLIVSSIAGADRSGIPISSGKRSDGQAVENEYISDDDDVAQLRVLVGTPRRDRHSDMPATSGAGSLTGLDDIEIEEFVELTNFDRRRERLPPLTRDEVLSRLAG